MGECRLHWSVLHGRIPLSSMTVLTSALAPAFHRQLLKRAEAQSRIFSFLRICKLSFTKTDIFMNEGILSLQHGIVARVMPKSDWSGSVGCGFFCDCKQRCTILITGAGQGSMYGSEYGGNDTSCWCKVCSSLKGQYLAGLNLVVPNSCQCEQGRRKSAWDIHLERVKGKKRKKKSVCTCTRRVEGFWINYINMLSDFLLPGCSDLYYDHWTKKVTILLCYRLFLTKSCYMKSCFKYYFGELQKS